MARLATIGFELGSFEAENLTSVGTVAQSTIVAGAARSGGLGMRCDTGAGNAFTGRIFTPPAGSLDTWYYVRVYFRVLSVAAGGVGWPPTQVSAILRALNSASARMWDVQLTTAGALKVLNSAGTSLYTGSPLNLDQWYCLEVGFRNGVGATDSYEVRLDGVTLLAATNTSALTDLALLSFRFGWPVASPGASCIIDMDDFAVNSEAGTDQASWCGDGAIRLAKPVADDARDANWVAGAGATVSLFGAVDNIPAIGKATGSQGNGTQIKNTAADTTGNYDAQLQSYDEAGVPATDTVKVLLPVARVSTVSTTSVPGRMRLMSNPAAGADVAIDFNTTQAAANEASTSWQTRRNSASGMGTPFYDPTVVRATRPVLRVGKNSATGTAFVDLMGLVIESVPARSVSPPAVASGEAMGAPTITQTIPTQSVSPTGVASSGAVGAPTISGPATHPAGIASSAAMGVPTVNRAGRVSQGEIMALLAGAITRPAERSLGGAPTGIDVVSGVDNNLFDDVTVAEAATGRTEYRLVYVKNNDVDAMWHDVRAYISSGDAGAHIALGVAVEGVGVQVTAIADEFTAPAGVVFSRPTSYATGLQINGSTGLAAGEFRGLWIRRTIAAGAAANPAYTAGIMLEGT